MSNLITSPVGHIKFLAVSKPVKNYDKTKEIYTMRLEFDGSVPENLAFRKQIEAINPKKIVTKDVAKAGNFIVSANSNFAPQVLDAKGNTLEGDAIPYFDSRTDKGTASMTLKPSTSGPQGTVYLKAVGLVNLELAEREESSNDGTAQLKAVLEKAHS